MKNFATACASVVNSATMALCALVMMFVFTMTGCDTGNEDDLNYSVGCTDCDDPNTNPDPEKTVVRVDHINGDCPVQNIEWSSKNATLTRSEEYTVAAADGGEGSARDLRRTQEDHRHGENRTPRDRYL